MKPVKIAILDLYEGRPNEGMRCIKEILGQFAVNSRIYMYYDIFDVRLRNEVPSLDYDIYISTGGPGSPLDSENSEWERKYFGFINDLITHNKQNDNKKHLFLICHSFQLFIRYFGLGFVTKRKSTSFGVYPVHKVDEGLTEPLLSNLNEPFYAVDSRDYQVIQPDDERIADFGAQILCLEKDRPHVPLERAVMAMRFTPEIFGTQFHPEADAIGMRMYFEQIDKRNAIIKEHGEVKYEDMIEQLKDQTKIHKTYKTIIPEFLNLAVLQYIDA